MDILRQENVGMLRDSILRPSRKFVYIFERKNKWKTRIRLVTNKLPSYLPKKKNKNNHLRRCIPVTNTRYYVGHFYFKNVHYWNLNVHEKGNETTLCNCLIIELTKIVQKLISFEFETVSYFVDFIDELRKVNHNQNNNYKSTFSGQYRNNNTL